MMVSHEKLAARADDFPQAALGLPTGAMAAPRPSIEVSTIVAGFTAQATAAGAVLPAGRPNPAPPLRPLSIEGAGVSHSAVSLRGRGLLRRRGSPTPKAWLIPPIEPRRRVHPPTLHPLTTRRGGGGGGRTTRRRTPSPASTHQVGHQSSTPRSPPQEGKPYHPREGVRPVSPPTPPDG